MTEHAVAGTSGAELHPQLDTSKAKEIIRKSGLKRIFLSGLVTEYCAGFSAMDRVEEGFEAYTITDTTVSFNNEEYDPMQKRWHDCSVNKITADQQSNWIVSSRECWAPAPSLG